MDPRYLQNNFSLESYINRFDLYGNQQLQNSPFNLNSQSNESMVPAAFHMNENIHNLNNLPKKKKQKRKTTAANESDIQVEDVSEPLSTHAIYMEKLFTTGSGSDFTIDFKSESFIDKRKTMKLHKTFLCQMSYFEAMFGAQWVESSESTIEINLTDENISEKSLDIVFKSLYTGRLDYKKSEDDLISIIATARFFSLDSAADTIAMVMSEVVTIHTVIYFYYSFGSYGYPQYEEKLFDMILYNFSYWNEFHHEIFSSKVLAHIEENFMEKLISHDDFVVMDEFTLYNILKRWLVDKMKLRDDYDFFKMWNRPEPFLDTVEGGKFAKVFSMLKLSQLCMEPARITQLKKDKIIRMSRIHKAGAENYLRLVNPTSLTTFTYRFAIFHEPTDNIFKGTTVGFHGIQLKFSWSNNTLMLSRIRHDRVGVCFHGSVNIKFRIVFYDSTTREVQIKVIPFEVKEGFWSPILMYQTNYNNPLRNFTTGNFPTVIGVKMEVNCH